MIPASAIVLPAVAVQIAVSIVNGLVEESKKSVVWILPEIDEFIVVVYIMVMWSNHSDRIIMVTSTAVRYYDS